MYLEEKIDLLAADIHALRAEVAALRTGEPAWVTETSKDEKTYAAHPVVGAAIEAAAAAKPAPEKPAPAKTTEELQAEAVDAATKLAAKGREKLVAALKEFGVDRVSKLEVKDLPKAIAAFKTAEAAKTALAA